MSEFEPGRDPLEDVVAGALRARAATNVLPPDGLDQIRLEVTRRGRRRRTTWLAAAAVLVLVVGIAGLAAARSSSDDSAPFVGPVVTSAETIPDVESSVTSPSTPAQDGAFDGECVETPSNGFPETAAVGGNDGAATLEEMVRTIWPVIAGDLALVDIGPSSYRCSLRVETSFGDFDVSGYQLDDGLWYLTGIGPTEQDDEFRLGEFFLGVQWLIDGTISVGSNATCAGCVTAEATAFAAGGTWVGRSGIPLQIEMQAPGSDGNRALLIRYFDADGAVRSVRFTSIPSGDFSAG
jgi:hypothetical protein